MVRVFWIIFFIFILNVFEQPTGAPLLVLVEMAEHGNLRDFLRARAPGRAGPAGAVSLREMLSYGWQVGTTWLDTRTVTCFCLALELTLLIHGTLTKFGGWF